jgi:arginine decarboxylase
MNITPRQVFFRKGAGTRKDELRSFELALRDAGIEKQNLVPVSSILPPGRKIIPRVQKLNKLSDGEIAFTVISRCASNEPHRRTKRGMGIFLNCMLSA